MPTLHDIQRFFGRALTDPPSEGLGAHIVGDEEFVRRRLNVYRNNILLTQRAALAAIFPTIRTLIGDECFYQCAKEYLRGNPSRDGNINALGEKFPEFLARYRATCTLDYLRDVARLEWAYQRAFHAPDEARLSTQDLSGVSDDRYDELKFQMHSSVAFLESRYPILKIWQAHLPGSEEIKIDLDVGGIRLLVARVGLDVEFVPLDIGAYAFLTRLSRGLPLVEAYADALAQDADFDLQRTLPFFIQSGFISKLIL